MADNWDLNYSPVALEGIKAGVGSLKEGLTALQATARFNTEARAGSAKVGDGVDGGWTKQYFADRADELKAAVGAFEQWVLSWENTVAGAHSTVAEWDEDARHKFDQMVADKAARDDARRTAD